MVECGGLENRYRASDRRFKSSTLRFVPLMEQSGDTKIMYFGIFSQTMCFSAAIDIYENYKR